MKNFISICLTLSCFCFVISMSAQQMGVNTVNPDGDAILDVTSSSKGLLVPRMTSGAVQMLSTPGLIVYNTGFGGQFNFLQGGSWKTLLWESSATDKFFVPPAIELGIGIDNPVYKLDISSSQYQLLRLHRETGATATVGLSNSSGNELVMGMASDGDFIVGNALGVNDDLIRIDAAGNAGELHVKDQEGGIVPCGGIIMWSGSSVPDGWALCDGTSSTPNLMDKFVRGGTTPGTGGSDNKTFSLTESNLPPHTHGSGTLKTSSDGDHSHDVSIPKRQGTGTPTPFTVFAASNNPVEDATFTTSTDGDHTHTISGLTDSTGSGTDIIIDVKPAYYTLAFIIKKCN